FVAASAFLQLPCAVSQTVSQLAVPGTLSVEGDGYLYVSGQGPHRVDGTVPGNFAEQVRQCLENIKTIVESAGLTMDHLVYTQVYLQDVSHYAELNDVYAAYFLKDPPARSVLGVVRVPEPPLQINAVAVRDLKGKQAVSVSGWPASRAYSAGILTHNRL